MKVAWSVMPFLGNYDSFKKSLDRLASLGCKSCRENGGNPCYELVVSVAKVGKKANLTAAKNLAGCCGIFCGLCTQDA